jgi:hypothetical protein
MFKSSMPSPGVVQGSRVQSNFELVKDVQPLTSFSR